MIAENYLYVDKTEYYHRLITKGKYYFLSRPRRFGKSLLISTLKAIFEGKRDLFEGLWIQDKIAWEPRPVILLDFTQISKRAIDLEEGIRLELVRNAQTYGVELTEGTNAGRLVQLIKLLSKEKQVAILVDEYDKPMIDNIDDLSMVNKNRQTLKDMYSVIKGNDEHIAFFMLTGVSKFSQVSIFSDLNNLYDITVDKEFAGMLGYTQQELNTSFAGRLAALAAETQTSHLDLMARIKESYNGYSWDGVTFVYNPFSILNLLRKQSFQDYWFATGTPTFLMKLIKQAEYSAFDFENKEVLSQSFNTFDIPNIDIHSLLFQTGYLTIKKIDDQKQTLTLDFPNKEVSNAFSFHLLAEFAEKRQGAIGSLLLQMNERLQNGEVDGFMESVSALFEDIAYPIHPSKGSSIGNMEKYYHSLFYLALRLLGYNIQAEVFTSKGRIDAVITTERYVYVVEFKLGDAASAMAQIKDRRYHVKYLGTRKKIVLLGIGFDVVTRNVGDFLVEEV